MRVLVSSTGGHGHFNPLLPFINASLQRGDEVLVIVPPVLRETVEKHGYSFRISEGPPEQDSARIWQEFPTLPPEQASVLMNREWFGRICTAATLSTCERAFAEWKPDLILREPCEYASAIVAERFNVPHAQIAISLSTVEASVLPLVAPVLEPYGDHMADRLFAAPYITRFPVSIDPSPFPSTMRFRDEEAVERKPLPGWWSTIQRPLIYLTFGSVSGALQGGGDIITAALEAVSSLDANVLVTTGRQIERSHFGRLPKNVHIEEWIPQQEVLPHASVVVCHGGSGTTLGALSAGVPLVMVPMFADQPYNARLIEAAGAGLMIASSTGSADERMTLDQGDIERLRQAITRVLVEVEFQHAAKRIAIEIADMAGPSEILERFS
ncbi:glycosyltransferase [Ferrimicrobium sp.]|uniref:glycosyltransferase n=1 Tax=Ferrimicrobium sp. TaxID=2926050 RepID=UPI002621A412|nr:glycosyltransferase [Ferrimicrobium sp.]